MTARIAQRAGIEAVYVGGYAVAAHLHGLPDIGLLGLAGQPEAVRRVAGAAPGMWIIADADTGYGSEPRLRQTARELSR